MGVCQLVGFFLSFSVMASFVLSHSLPACINSTIGLIRAKFMSTILYATQKCYSLEVLDQPTFPV